MGTTLDVTLPSDLRALQIQIDGLRSIMRPNFTIQPSMTTLLEAVSRDLAKLVAEASAWAEEARTARFAKQTASLQARVSRIGRPPPRRRR